jgi:DNA polymerase-3 subunit beta
MATDTTTTHITVQRKVLLDALRTIAPAVARNGSLEALRCVRLTRDNGHLVLRGSKLELAGRLTLPYVEAEAELDTLVPHKALVDGLRGLDCAEVRLSADGTGLAVANGTRQVHVPAQPDEYFPAWTSERGELVLTAKAGEFSRQVQRLASHASKDETRPVLTGMYLDGPNGCAVATDSYRLVCVYPGFEWVGERDQRESLNLPAGALAAVVKKWGKRPRGQVELYRHGSQATLVYGDQQWQLRVIDGQYPNYRQLVPDSSSYALDAVLSGARLAETCKAADKLPHHNRPLRVTVIHDQLTCRMQGEPGQPPLLEESLPAQTRLIANATGPAELPMEVGFNPGFLADVATAMGEHEVRLRFISPLRPLFVEAPEHHADWALLMPIRLDV